MARPSWLLVVCLTLPLPVLAAGSSALADGLGRRAGALLGDTARVLLRSPKPAPAPVFVEVLPAPDPPVAATRVATPLAPAARPPRASPPVPKKGVRVRAEVVLRLANSGARPGGFPVAASGERPRGLALTGVSGLGIGLEDGDVLTHAAGRPALTPGDVIGVVIGSRAAREPEIWGRFWRNGEPWNLVVEQPYPKKRRAPEGPSTSASGAGAS